MTVQDLNTNIGNILKSSGGYASLCLWPIRDASDPTFSGIVNTRTLDLCLALGHMFMTEKPEHRLTKLAQIIKSRNVKIYLLFSGTVKRIISRSLGNQDYTLTEYVNSEGKRFVTFGENETLMAWNVSEKRYQAIGPDVITPLDWNYSPLDTTSVKAAFDNGATDKIFHVVGIQTWPNLRQSKLLVPFIQNISSFIARVQSNIEKEVHHKLPKFEKYIPIEKLPGNKPISP